MLAHRTSIPTSLLASRLPEGSPFAGHLRRSGAPSRLDLDGLDAEVRKFGAPLGSPETSALALPRQILAAKPFDTERGRALEAAAGTAQLRSSSPVRSSEWFVQESAPLSGAPVLSPNGKVVYQLNEHSELSAYARADGAKLWSLPVGGGWRFHRPQVSADGQRMVISTIVDNRDEQQVTLVDLAKREVVWRRDLTGYPIDASASCTVDGQALVHDNGARTLAAYHRDTGEKIWELPLPKLANRTYTDAPALATESKVVFSHLTESSKSLVQYGLDPHTGEVSWEHELPGTDFGFFCHGLTPDQQSMVTVDEKGVTCRSLETGEEEWRVNVPVGSTRRPPVFSPDGERMAIASISAFYISEVETGKQLLRVSDARNTRAPRVFSEPMAFTADGDSVFGLPCVGPVRFNVGDQQEHVISIPERGEDSKLLGWSTDGEWGFLSRGDSLESVPLKKADG
jgi:outer membrane protein assembly factor BamB